MYRRNRYYDPSSGRFTQEDPIGLAGGLNVYGFANGDPVTYSDPYGLDAIKILFKGYRISTPFGRIPLGHAAVIAVNPETGFTRYFEYGRYPDPATGEPSTRGFVRTRPVPNVEIGEDGRPTQASLQNLYNYVSEHYGQGRPVEASYYADSEYQDVVDFAEQRMRDADRADYNLVTNNCSTFAQEAVEAGRKDVQRGTCNHCE